MTIFDSSNTFRRGSTVAAFVALLVLLVASPGRAETSRHVVSNNVLQQQLQTHSNARRENIQSVTKFFSTPLAQRAMKIEHVSPTQVKNAIPTLSDSELANLSSRANQAQEQFAAGTLSTNQMLLLIIVLLVVVILVAVH